MAAQALAIAAIAMAASNAIASYYGGRSQARMQEQYYRYLSEQASIKGKLADRYASDVISATESEYEQQVHQMELMVKKLSATQSVAMVKNGIDLSSVTAEDINKDNLTRFKLDQMVLAHNADRRIYQAKVEAQFAKIQAQSDAGMYLLGGQMQASATRQQATNQLIGNTGSLLNQSAKYWNTYHGGKPDENTSLRD